MRRLPLAALLLLAAGCAASPARSPEWASLREVTPEFLAARGARQASLAADTHGRVALTFVTRDTSGAMDLWLSISTDGGVTFGEPQRVNERPGAVSSFAEARPMAAFGEGGRLALVWTEMREASGHGHGMAADVWVRSSGDGGANLGPTSRVNDDADGKPAYHGFATLAFAPDGALFAAWMDERENPPVEGEASSAALYGAVSRDGGQRWEKNRRITDRLCPCCRNAIATAAPGTVAIVYRSAGHDLRDPALALSTDGGATFAMDTLLSPDGWKVDACPVAGPALTASADGGMVAWYSEAEGPRVYVAPWRAGVGLSGVRRAMTDSLHDAAHPRLASAGAATFVAVEGRPAADTSRTVLAVRAIELSGATTPWLFLGADVRDGWLTSLGPAAALASWTEKDPAGPRVRLARIARR